MKETEKTVVLCNIFKETMKQLDAIPNDERSIADQEANDIYRMMENFVQRRQ